LNDFWQKRHKEEATLPLREVAHGHGSPGQIFKLPEEDIRTRVDALSRQTRNYFTSIESASLQQIHKRGDRDGIELLKEIYSVEGAHV